MKMKKAVLGVAAVFTAMLLAACGDKTVATLNGGKITQNQYYSSLKNSDSGKQVLSTMIINDALQDQYGKKVSDKSVTKQFNDLKKQYGDQFKTQLAQSGQTESGLKESIKTQKLLEVAVKANTKISAKQLDTQFKAYQPKVTVRYILLKNDDSGKKNAEKVIKDLEGAKDVKADFIKLAKKYSQDASTANKGGLYTPFDNTDTNTDASFKEAAFKLNNGEFTKTAVHSDQFGYFVLYMDNKGEKPAKITPAIKKTLEDQIMATNMNDQTKISEVIAKVLKKAKVSIKDKDMSNILDQYMNPSKAPAAPAAGEQPATTGN